tara:strand:- start:1562 stop:2575 length:1014 start_codon:yes stop_codon:yes gene_type:complete
MRSGNRIDISSLAHTSIDKVPPQPRTMTEFSVEPLPFHPAQIWQWDEGYIAVGIDGEFLKLDLKLQTSGEVRKPFPCSVQSTALLGKEMVVTWVDHELMLARMASFALDKGFEDGPDRGELRTRTSIEAAIHPAGAVWSHVLDAEPLALCSNDEQFAFILWQKGIYAMGIDKAEHWRKPEPEWKELERFPHGEVIVSASIQGSLLHVWSRGAAHNVYQCEDGELVNSEVIECDGILNSVYSHDENHLLCFENGEVMWYRPETPQVLCKLKGPAQHAVWSVQHDAWHIAGWREEVLFSETKNQRHVFDEIPVQLISYGNSILLLMNDGTFVQSSFKDN